MKLRRGFTLLEVMISLAILAIALVALSDVNAGAVQMHYFARRSTQATLLLRGKMLDLEDKLHKDGFSDFDDEQHGNFEEEGSPEYTWRAEILKPDIQLDESSMMNMLGLNGSNKTTSAPSASGGISGGLGGALNAASASLPALGGALGGAGAAAMGGPLGGVISGQAKTFIETLKKSVREVRLTVYWKDGGNERQLSASQQIVILPESVGRAGQDNPNALPTQNGVQPGTTPTTNPVTGSVLGGTRPPRPEGTGDTQ